MTVKYIECKFNNEPRRHLLFNILHNFQVCEEEEVLELDAQSLGSLLGSDDLNISQEQVLLELVLRWVQRRRGDLQSETEAAELLRHVRLELVDPGFLRKARRRNPVRVLFSFL